MKRIILSILILAICSFSALIAYSQSILELKKGTLVLVYARKNLSTETLQEGDKVYFISPSDVWLDETKAIPKDSIFVGFVSMLKMPIKGINAAIKFDITHLILPNGEIKEIKGHINDGRQDIIGGELAPPASYNQMTHLYQSRWKWSGTTQWVPSGDYEFGRHRGVSTQQQLYVVFDEPYYFEQRYD